MQIDKLALIFIRNKKLLATMSKGKDVYYLPGGKRNGNETDEEALVREIKEEMSVDLIPESIQYFNTYEAQAHGKPEGTTVRITCYIAEFNGILTPANEIERIVWVDSSDAEKATVTGKIILEDLKSK